MKTIGFIDYYLDEWHANKYPEWIEQASGGTMKVACAYGLNDVPGRLDNAAWAAKMGIELLDSIEAVVERSDCLIVLSPDNPEFHEQLAMLPLQSGKPTYVDKTFAPDRKTAQLLFDTAAKHGTPLYSSSALRYASEYAGLGDRPIDSICSIGPGQYDNYAIHQIEPIVMLMGTEAERIMFVGTQQSPAWLIEFSGGRQASIHHYHNSPFRLTLNDRAGSSTMATAETNFFAPFIDHLVQFFQTGKPAVAPAETIAIITIIEYGHQAAKTPYVWVELPGNSNR